MKQITSILLAVALTAIFALSAAAEDVPVKIASVKGAATVVIDGVPSPAQQDATLKTGDSIETGADGEVSLKWGDGHLVKVYPLSKFKLDDISKTGGVEKNSLNIESGKMFAKARKLSDPGASFEIKTPTAIAAVRGSEIFVSSAPDSAQFSVLSGAFDVSGEGLETVVAQNFRVEVTSQPQAATEVQPTPIPQDELQDLKTEASEVYTEVGEPQEAAAPSEGDSDEEEASTDEGTDEETEASADEGTDIVDESAEVAEDSVDDSINENIVNDTVVAPGTDDILQDLEAGMGGVSITIE